ncbi:hypothetical protein BH11PSE2_BH11PSE2_00790 [soil metagenome]
MRSVQFAVVGVLSLAVLVAGCDKIKPEGKADGAPDKVAAAPAAVADANAATPAECAIIATHVKVELGGSFGMPLNLTVPARASQAVDAKALGAAFPALTPAQTAELADGVNKGTTRPFDLTCNWKAAGVAEPQGPVRGENDLRFDRPAITAAGDVALLDVTTNLDGFMSLAVRCLYTKDGGAWKRQTCVPTKVT